MSLDVYLEKLVKTDVYEANITHNLAVMAREVDDGNLYLALWHPQELDFTSKNNTKEEEIYAWYLIDYLEKGLEILKDDKKRLVAFNPENAWGTYDDLVEFVEKYLAAIKENPEATVRTST